MTTVTLNPDLVQQIENLSSKEDSDAQSFVERAVRAYLVQIQREKIRTETEAFNAQVKMLHAKYAGQYVAIHQGKVIDSDSDLRTLHLRVYELVGRTPVLLKRVMSEPEREIVFRSPRLERNGT